MKAKDFTAGAARKLHGMKCIALTIKDLPISGKISVRSDKTVFLVHDNESANGWKEPDDTFGYGYAWCLFSRTQEDEEISSEIKDIKIDRANTDTNSKDNNDTMGHIPNNIDIEEHLSNRDLEQSEKLFREAGLVERNGEYVPDIKNWADKKMREDFLEREYVQKELIELAHKRLGTTPEEEETKPKK